MHILAAKSALLWPRIASETFAPMLVPLRSNCFERTNSFFSVDRCLCKLTILTAKSKDLLSITLPFIDISILHFALWIMHWLSSQKWRKPLSSPKYNTTHSHVCQELFRLFWQKGRFWQALTTSARYGIIPLLKRATIAKDGGENGQINRLPALVGKYVKAHRLRGNVCGSFCRYVLSRRGYSANYRQTRVSHLRIYDSRGREVHT